MKKFFLAIGLSLIIGNQLSAQIADSSKREVKLEGAINFRDIGGYKTKDGRHVRWGKIYRSAALNSLTNADLDKLRSLKIAVDADFRGDYEASVAPDRIPSNIRRISLPAGSQFVGTPSNMKEMFQSKNSDSIMLSFYTNTAVFKDRYKPVFDELLEVAPDSALLYHCSAGKDRTGMGTALVLFALGVPEQTIMSDYLASNYYRNKAIEKEVKQMVDHFGLTKTQALEMSGVKEEYLMATYQAIVQQYGSVNSFLEKELDLTPEKIERLKVKFLE